MCQQAYVTDLGSRTGSQLGGQALAPHQREPWDSAHTLKLGAYSVRLVGIPSALNASSHDLLTDLLASAPAAATQLVDTRLDVAPAPGQYNIVIIPGQPTVTYVSITNHSSKPDTLVISIEGVPAQWVDNPTQLIAFESDEQILVPITVNVPKTPGGRAGEYQVTVNVRSTRNSRVSGSANMRWHVRPFAANRLDLALRRARHIGGPVCRHAHERRQCRGAL